MTDPEREPRRGITVERILWALVVGLIALVVTIAGSWVGSMERRVTAAEAETLSLKKDAAIANRDIAEMRTDIKTILELLRRR